MIRTIVGGTISGTVLKSAQPINFLGMVDRKTGTVKDPKHDIHGKELRGRILAFPHGIGSSVGAYSVYALHANNVSPAAMICTRPDASVVSGCAIAGIPMLLVDEQTFESIRDGQEMSIDTTRDAILA